MAIRRAGSRTLAAADTSRLPSLGPAGLSPGLPRGLVLVLLLAVGPAGARQQATPDPGKSRALIVVGLPGDAEHRERFAATARRWREWLTGTLGFPAAEVRILGTTAGPDADPGEAPATAEAIIREVAELRARTAAADRVWVFVLGHANALDGHAYLHLPGPDLRDDQFAALFGGLPAREQVFWITTPHAGSFLPPLSAPGRIVVAATARDGEPNETEFPAALADVAGRPAAELDADRDGRVSVREVFAAVAAAVEARYAADRRVPTEHAQIDDDGDGVGAEASPVAPPARPDGALASRTYLPAAPPPPTPTPRPER